jgi:hypothetical protein
MTMSTDTLGRRLVPVAALAVAGALLSGAPAAADRGVSIDVGRVAVTQKLLPGGGYRLPAFGVRNPGDEPATYRMVSSSITGQAGKEAPPQWFRFRPSTFTLEPGATRAVTARIDLPAGADPGDYEALVGAQLVGEADGATVGAEAAARVSFSVEPSSLLAAYWLETKRFFSTRAPWSWVVPLVLALAGVAAVVRRRFSFSVARKAA